MAVRDRLRKNAARYVAPGEQIQAVFYAMRSAMECSDRAVVATGRRPAELSDDMDWILAASGRAESGNNRLPLIG